MVIDVQRRRGDRLGAPDQIDAAAPGQKQRVFAAVDETRTSAPGVNSIRTSLLTSAMGRVGRRHHHDGTEVRPNC